MREKTWNHWRAWRERGSGVWRIKNISFDSYYHSVLGGLSCSSASFVISLFFLFSFASCIGLNSGFWEISISKIRFFLSWNCNCIVLNIPPYKTAKKCVYNLDYLFQRSTALTTDSFFLKITSTNISQLPRILFFLEVSVKQESKRQLANNIICTNSLLQGAKDLLLANNTQWLHKHSIEHIG